jgi:DNA-binding IclR family transcriptional regulator
MPGPTARSAARAVAVLDYFTTNPQRAFTLSELSIAVGASLSSLSSVLQSLMEAGYLVRHPRHKTYELGPALVAVGRAASLRHPVVELARPELARLAAEYDTECVGSVVIGDEILVLALEGRPSHRTRGLTLGQRVPFAPPFGEIWLAYGGPEALHSWLRRTGHVSGNLSATYEGETAAELESALAQVRARGYAVNLRTDRLAAYSDALSLLVRRPGNASLQQRIQEMVADLGAGYVLLDEHPDTRYEVEMIIAPVFGPDGAVVFALTLVGLAERTGTEIAQIAARIVESGLGLTRAIGGRVPLDSARSVS